VAWSSSKAAWARHESTRVKYSNPALVEHLAAQYVLGTLSTGARRRFERLLRERADVQLAVQHWQQRLGALAQSVPAAQPSPQVWQRITAQTAPSTAVQPRGWRWPAAWGLSGLATGLIAAFAVFTLAPALFVSTDQVAMQGAERLPQSYVGLLTDAQGNGKVLVSSLRHGKTMAIKMIGPLPAPAQGLHVLWALPADAPPFKLGVLPQQGTAVAQLPDTSEKLLSKVSKLMVTLEPNTNITTPSSNIVLQGNCAKLW
jgi:anti-sigma-K factor RskA